MNEEKDKASSYQVPVACGFPSPAQDYVSTRISLDSALIRYPESTYLLRASGDAMRDAGIRDGDLLIVECYHEPRNGDIVIAVTEGEFLCRRLQLGSHPALMPENPVFDPVPLHDETETAVFGIVRHVIHHL